MADHIYYLPPFLFFPIPVAEYRGVYVLLHASHYFTCLNEFTLNSRRPFLQRSALNQVHVNLQFRGAGVPLSSVH